MGKDGGRFSDWSTRDLAAQCRMQAREQLDPEFSQFMSALAERLERIDASGITRAAIEALLEPSPDMIAAGTAAIQCEGFADAATVAGWQAMLTVILEQAA
jgi:hypothetical protein